MLKARRFITWILITGGMAIFQIIWNGYFPHPFNQCQVIFAGLIIWMLFTKNRPRVFWTLLIIYWIFDSLSSAPTGINSFSALSSFIILERLSSRVLTGHTANTAILLSVFGVIIFRVIYLLISFGTGFIYINQPGSGTLLTEFLWEIILTSVAATLIFFIATLGLRRFNPRYILMDNRILYGWSLARHHRGRW